MGALSLLGLFIIAISINLARGRTHDCHCFGQLHSRPLAWPTLVRNLLFALGAGFVLWQALIATVPGIVPAIVDLRSTEQLLLMVGVVVTAVILVYLQRRGKRQVAEAATREGTPEGLPLDSIAPAFELAAYHGGSRSLAELIDHGTLATRERGCGGVQRAVDTYRRSGEYEWPDREPTRGRRRPNPQSAAHSPRKRQQRRRLSEPVGKITLRVLSDLCVSAVSCFAGESHRRAAEHAETTPRIPALLRGLD